MTRYMHPLEQVIRRRPAHICDRCDYVDDPAQDRPCYCTADDINRIRAAADRRPERNPA